MVERNCAAVIDAAAVRDADSGAKADSNAKTSVPHIYVLQPQDYRLTAAWPGDVRVFVTTRSGGVSLAPYATANLGLHVGDCPQVVALNRARLTGRLKLPAAVQWLNQVHGTHLVAPSEQGAACPSVMTGDGILLRHHKQAGVVLTADCLSVFFARRDGQAAAVVHAGWRGLAAGILEKAVVALGNDPDQVLAFLGPAILPHAFEVKADVYRAFVEKLPESASAFVPVGAGCWRAMLGRLAWLVLRAAGVQAIEGWGVSQQLITGQHNQPTFGSPPFFSYRAANPTGRFASVLYRV